MNYRDILGSFFFKTCKVFKVLDCTYIHGNEEIKYLFTSDSYIITPTVLFHRAYIKYFKPHSSGSKQKSTSGVMVVCLLANSMA